MFLIIDITSEVPTTSTLDNGPIVFATADAACKGLGGRDQTGEYEVIDFADDRAVPALRQAVAHAALRCYQTACSCDGLGLETDMEIEQSYRDLLLVADHHAKLKNDLALQLSINEECYADSDDPF